jgi:RNA polymerase sigma-70 factor, ECF subfamily
VNWHQGTHEPATNLGAEIRFEVFGDNEFIGELIAEVKGFAARLGVPQCVRDDIVSDVCLVIARRVEYLKTLDNEAALRWARGTTFLVALRLKRSQFRRTSAWYRLRSVFEVEEHSRFNQHDDEMSVVLLDALNALTDLDRLLLIENIWDGYTTKELADRHSISPIAVRVRISRARKLCRQSIRPDLFPNRKS